MLVNLTSYLFSYDYGRAHIIIVSTEVYFYLNQRLGLIAKQKIWLKQDLEVSVETAI